MPALHRSDLPHCVGGLRVGLLGGSFDPPHSGHVQATQWALKKLDLDRVWWLFSTGNPLKARRPADLTDRIREASERFCHPRVVFSDLEMQFSTVRTVDTLERLQSVFPGAHFVWLMGADNLTGIHRWACWKELFDRVPVGVLSRRDHRFAASRSVGARTFGSSRIPEAEARKLATLPPPSWTMVHMPYDDTSSTRLRESQIS